MHAAVAFVQTGQGRGIQPAPQDRQHPLRLGQRFRAEPRQRGRFAETHPAGLVFQTHHQALPLPPGPVRRTHGGAKRQPVATINQTVGHDLMV